MRRAVRGAAVLTAAAAVAASLAGCTAAAVTVGTLSWSACGDGTLCATLAVPVDHAAPSGPTIDLAVVRVPARDPERRIGALFVNPGGPGGSGVEYVRNAVAGFDDETRDRFDVIGFDPRGVEASGAVRCGFDERPGLDELHGEALDRFVAETCQDGIGDLLPHVTTVATARDLDLLREALGDERLSYLGFSYGTILGAVYADLFPERVRALVLDSALDPVEWFDDRVPLEHRSAVAFADAFDAFAAGCLRNARACAFGDGDPAGALDRLLERADTTGVPVPGGEPLDRESVIAAVGTSLYTEASWPVLGDALRAAQDGDGSALEEITAERARTDGRRSNYLDANLSLVCGDANDRPDPAERAARYAELEGLSPVFGRYADMGGNCAFWPQAAEVYHPPAELTGTPRVLVVNSTGDPATPLDGAEALAGRFTDSAVVVVDGWQHGIYAGGNACVDDVVGRYLADPATVSGRTACPAAAPVAG